MTEQVILDFSKERPSSFPDMDHVKYLSLNGCSEWVADDVIESLSVGGNLESVSLFRCWRITDRAVYNLMKNNGSKIKHLVLAGCTSVSDKSLSYIARFSTAGIESLDITRCPRVSDIGINYLSASTILAQSIKSFRLYADSQLSSSGHCAISDFSNLEELDLCGHENLSDKSLLNILTKCPKIRSLNLSWCSSLTDSVTACIIQNGLLHQIQSLSLFGNKAISNVSILVEYLAHKEPPIRELDIRGIPEVAFLTSHDCEGLRKCLPTIENWKLHT